MPSSTVGVASDDATLTLPALAAASFRSEVQREIGDLALVNDDERLIATFQRIADAVGEAGDVMVTAPADALMSLVDSATRTLTLDLEAALAGHDVTTTIRQRLLAISTWVDVIDGHDWLASRYTTTTSAGDDQ